MKAKLDHLLLKLFPMAVIDLRTLRMNLLHPFPLQKLLCLVLVQQGLYGFFFVRSMKTAMAQHLLIERCKFLQYEIIIIKIHVH